MGLMWCIGFRVMGLHGVTVYETQGLVFMSLPYIGVPNLDPQTPKLGRLKRDLEFLKLPTCHWMAAWLRSQCVHQGARDHAP